VAAGGGGGVHEAVVVGGSVQVGDVLLGGDEGELGMHGLTSCVGLWCEHCDPLRLQPACSPVNARPGNRNGGWAPSAVFGRRGATGIGTVVKAYAFRDPGAFASGR
jgi:hypothetical protein